MNYKTLNLIKNILTFPFRVVFRTIKFILTPVMFMVGFCMTDWKDEFDRDYFCGEIKNSISFGFWK